MTLKSILTTAVLLVTLSTAMLGGCGSSRAETATPEQKERQTSKAASQIPPQAQALTAQQNQQKTQMDAMRAKDAAKAAK
jgi:outer membrane murein-binding lipoprotein Lpp